jgi:Hint domain
LVLPDECKPVSATLINTSTGSRPVENLQVGDALPTAQNSLQTIRWIGSRHLSAMTLREVSRLHPVRIVSGALGNGLPKRDLVVARKHRDVVSSQIAYRMLGAQDVMIPAIKLTELPCIFVEEDHQDIMCFHVLLDCHEASPRACP